MDQNNLMERAAALALQKMRANQGGPFGAVIVRGGEVIAEGWNQVTSANDPTGHAEVTAIRNACAKLETFSLEGCDIYTNCEPCPMCLGAIYWARIQRIYYSNTRSDAAKIGFDDDFIYREIGIPLAERSIPSIRVANATAELAFSEWAAKPDKRRY
ncbi:nucleoside deaminase [Rhodoplanes sp. Z2-YC6860]|uniref:nucleoside deaminase n=1 Tax=Rhodoplanes sp. Z2-YC6860 TaxID=674703 RepID=UPI00078ED13A|nr:nucleoside deaminase [Rhodoplanes sp. Z2-YC6860]AMN40273.1 guanine deaminase [Rhodoplanes sp. Z2-YC6860]